MTPEELLSAEHGRLRQLVATVDAALEQQPPEEPVGKAFAELQAALQKHFRQEEPYYGRIDAGKRFHDRGLMHTLRNDHAAVLFTLESLRIRLRKSGLTAEWRERYASMCKVLLWHFQTEENDLFPEASTSITESERDALFKEMQERE